MNAYHGRVVKIGMSGSKLIAVLDSQASITNRIKDHIVEDVVVVDKRTEDEIEDEVVTHVEVGLQVTHVVESLDEIEFYQLN